MPNTTERKTAVAVIVRRRRTKAAEARTLLATIEDSLVAAGGRVLPSDPTDAWVVGAAYDTPLGAVRAAEAVRRRLGRRAPAGTGVAVTPTRARDLAGKSPQAAILVDRHVLDAVRDYVLAASTGADADEFLVTAVTGAGERDWHKRIQTAAALIGAVASLAAWVILVGGATMWARLHAAHVPEGQGLAVLPRQLLVAEGVRVLAVSFVIALVAAACAYAVASDQAARLREWSRGTVARNLRTTAALLAVIAIAVLEVVVILRWLAVEGWYLAWLVLTALVASGALVVALRRLDQDRPLVRFFSLFAILLVSAGVIGFLRELGSEEVRLDRAVVTDERGRTWQALFIARTADSLYVARKGADTAVCRIQVLKTSDVRDLRIRKPDKGEEHKDLCPAERDDQADLAVTTVYDTVTVPGETVTVAGGIVTIVADTVTLPAVTETETVAEKTITETTNVETPAGAVRISRQKISIPISSVQPPLRLEISKPQYSPKTPLRTTDLLTMTVRITATDGYVVRGAKVYVRALRPAYFKEGPGLSTAWTNDSGYANVKLQPTDALPFGRGVQIGLFVKASNPDGSNVIGVSRRRLVNLLLGPRTDRQ